VIGLTWKLWQSQDFWDSGGFITEDYQGRVSRMKEKRQAPPPVQDRRQILKKVPKLRKIKPAKPGRGR